MGKGRKDKLTYYVQLKGWGGSTATFAHAFKPAYIQSVPLLSHPPQHLYTPLAAKDHLGNKSVFRIVLKVGKVMCSEVMGAAQPVSYTV